VRTYPKIAGITILKESEQRRFNTIYQGYHHETNSIVAIKIHTSKSQKLQYYFQQEVEVLRKLSNLSVAPNYVASGTAEFLPYHVCTWAQGSTVSEIIELGLIDDLDQIVALIRSIASSVETIQACGFCHRDVSPEHIFLRSDGSVLIIDYGMACLLQSFGVEERNRYGGYDTLAIGMIFCELLVGKLLFNYRTPAIIRDVSIVWSSLLGSSLLPAYVSEALKYALSARSEFGCMDQQGHAAQPGQFAQMLNARQSGQKVQVKAALK
jgi:serine/threonine protein kinase